MCSVSGFPFIKYVPVTFSSHLHWLLLLLLIAGAIGLSFWVYRTTIPPIARGKKILLVTLRSITLVLLVLLIAEPLLRISRTFLRKPVIAVIADNSLSMTLADGAGNREQQLRAIFSDAGWEKLSADCDVERYSIAPVFTHTPPDSLALRGTSTDIAAALAGVLARGSEPVRAVVLLSDGNYNTGANPLSVAERFPVPIYTIGIGDSTEQKDVVVSKVTGNAIAYVESSVPVDATIKISGYSGAAVRVLLFDDGKQVDQTSITATASAEAADHPVRFLYVPKSEGMHRISVRTVPLPGESTEKNNSRSFAMKVLKNKMRVVVVAGAPGPDAAAVMQTLQSDKNCDPAIFYQTADGELRAEPARAVFAASAAAADCIVLVGFPTQQTTAQHLQTVIGAVRSKSLPLLFISGRTIDLEKLKQLEPLLPFTIASSRMDEQQVIAAIPASQQSNLLMGADGSAAGWEKLPPIFASIGAFKAKPEAAVLATMKIQGVTLSVPLIVSRSIGAQKTMAVLGYGIGRWKLLAGASTETASFFTSWFTGATRWLSTREEDKRLRVEPEKEIFSQGEPAALFAQAYSETYDPLDNVDVRIEAVEQTSKQKFETVLAGIGSGRYEGSFTNLGEGEYDFLATASIGGQAFGSVRGRFAVGEQALEFTDTKLNSTLMRQIASLSSGVYAPAAEYRSVQEVMRKAAYMKPEEETGISEFDMWSLPLLFAIILLCAGSEWFIRKQSGMV